MEVMIIRMIRIVRTYFMQRKTNINTYITCVFVTRVVVANTQDRRGPPAQ